MRKVYLVTYTDYDAHEIFAAFSERSGAEDFIEQHAVEAVGSNKNLPLEVEEYPLDAVFNTYKVHGVLLRQEGEAIRTWTREHFFWAPAREHSQFFFGSGLETQETVLMSHEIVQPLAAPEVDAVRLAKELRQDVIAAGEWPVVPQMMGGKDVRDVLNAASDKLRERVELYKNYA